MTDERFYSVTTILKGGIPNEALTYWAVNATVDYAVDKRAAWTTLAEHDIAGAKDLLKRSRFQTSGRASDRGSELHAFAEAWVKDAPIGQVDDTLRPYVDQFTKFCDDFDPQYEMAEASVYNRTYNYAGTLDAILRIGDVRFVVDYKTTDRAPTAKTRPPYPDVALQLAAYANAEWVALGPTRRTEIARRRYYLWNDETDQAQPMPTVDAGAALVISPFDYQFVTVRIFPFVDDTGETHDAFRTFLYAREVFRWNANTSRLVLGDVLAPA